MVCAITVHRERAPEVCSRKRSDVVFDTQFLSCRVKGGDRIPYSLLQTWQVIGLAWTYTMSAIIALQRNGGFWSQVWCSLWSLVSM